MPSLDHPVLLYSTHLWSYTKCSLPSKEVAFAKAKANYSITPNRRDRPHLKSWRLKTTKSN